MATEDQRWAAAALGVLALSAAVVMGGRPPTSNEWIRLPAAMLTQAVVTASMAATSNTETSKPLLAEDDEEAVLMSAIYIIPANEDTGPRMAQRRM